MSYFKILGDDELAPEAQSLFQEVIDKFQSVPVFYRILAVAPALLQTYWYSYQKVVLEGELPAQVKELIFLAVARKRRCIYCASAHLAICDIFEIERSTLETIMSETTDIQPERIAILLKFCLLAMDDPDAITAEQYQNLYNHGMTQIEILEALYTVAYSNGGIFMAKALKVEVEDGVKKYLSDNALSIGFI